MEQQKKKTIPVLPLKCGECSGLHRDRLTDPKLNCSALGKIESSKACNSFKADVFSLTDTVELDGALLGMAKLFNRLSPSQLKRLASVMYHEPLTRKAGYRFGQRVFVRYRGMLKDNYFSNFMIAHVLDANKQDIRLISRDGRCVLTFDSDSGPNGPTIWTKPMFEPLRQQMLVQERYIDPEIALTENRIKSREQYNLAMANTSKRGDIATIDDVFKDNNIKQGKKVVNDLVSIIRDLQSGYSTSGKFFKRVEEPTRKKRSADVELEV